ncbi:DUF4394 domain-containing protein [Pseudonocardia broussonetiae]|uniref:DUF4394 domain-containing protein n=1 Tax=Pseudonocardia broussonetiae TaxID=2736640 RepID=A0A6M6JML6_9PSEU|nr:DUF4394 domain-containing protein [Pseudonocardia broussonetiae]QJY47862.1 DUF4394 domain-containing protein [Pseudonocardia broussonetiae]
MRTSLRAGLVTVATGALLAVPLSAASATERHALDVVGLVDGITLVDFETDDTDQHGATDVTGLDGDVSLVGIDYRVQDGALYGVGDAGGIYTIDGHGKATKVAQLSIDLDGELFGVDFNPAANALRVVSDTGQNLRQPFAMPGAPTVADTALTNPAVAPATGTTPAAGVTAVGYTNNDDAAGTATTLFAVDTAADRVAIQSPANAGTLAPTGGLGVDAGPDAGADIYTAGGGNRAFATLEVSGTRRLFEVDLLTGAVEHLGALDGVTDIALPIDQG